MSLYFDFRFKHPAESARSLFQRLLKRTPTPSKETAVEDGLGDPSNHHEMNCGIV
jgi:hypothetical protein